MLNIRVESKDINFLMERWNRFYKYSNQQITKKFQLYTNTTIIIMIMKNQNKANNFFFFNFVNDIPRKIERLYIHMYIHTCSIF